MKFKLFAIIVIALLVTTTALAASGVLFAAKTKESGYNDAAFYAYHAGNSRASEAMYLRAIEENPQYELARYNLATLYFEERRFDDAIVQLDALLSLNSEKASYHYDLAVNLVENIRQNERGIEHFDRAIAEYEIAERLSPGFAHATENIAALKRIKAEFTLG